MGASLSIQRTCLNPTLSLRVQMFLSFGITAVIAISAFVTIGLYTTVNSGESVRKEAGNVLEQAIRYSLGRSAQYVAETMAKKFDNIGGAGSVIAEATRDRFVGYRSMEGWKTDDFVPFQDILTGRMVYPIDAEPLPLDWNVTGNINAGNDEEHMPFRSIGWYRNDADLSSYHAAYFMQGMCDPQQSDPNHPEYYPDCTEANNNILQGGVVYPTETNYFLANKGKDLVWVLKPIYESHLDVKTVGVYFANDGAGSVVRYPAASYNGQANFTSIGCQWMASVHPKTNQSVGTDEHIARCNRTDEVHSMRRYNPLERSWCRDQVERDLAVHDGRLSRDQVNIMSSGPYLDAHSIGGAWVMTFGQAVFDMLTHQFIACTLVDVSVSQLYDILFKATKHDQETVKSALIRWDEQGTVVVASDWDPDNKTILATVTDPDLGLGVDTATYNEIRGTVDYTQKWDPETVISLYRETIFTSAGRLIMTHPVPSVPKHYDPHYYPVYFVIISMERKEAYDVLTNMEILIEENVQSGVKGILIVGGTGFGVVLLSIAFISGTLTQPLQWMQKVAGKIVDNAGGHDLSQAVPNEDDAADAKPCCSPRTEVTLLLAEFIKMINEFSGVGAAEVAGGTINEVKNRFEWKKMYRDLYPWGVDSDDESVTASGFPKQLSTPTGKTSDGTFEDDMTIGTQTSIFSLISASLPAQYVPAVENAVEQTTTLLTSVKEYAVMAGTKAGIIAEAEPEKVEGPPKVHCGQNVHHPIGPVNDYFEGVEQADNSYLFWWTTFFIGTPIVVTAILISVTVARDASRNIPIWLADVETKTIDIELGALITATRTRAAFGEEVMHRFARDLHIYTRLAGWLLLGSLKRADSMTFQAMGDEECKFYDKESNETCPFDDDDTLSPCLCEWDDPWPGKTCETLYEVLLSTGGHPFNTSFNMTHPRNHTRYWQHRWFAASASDNDENGNRFSTSFPDIPGIDDRANTTNWWNDTRAMPGAHKGRSASGYETTYDRMRVLSALSVADFSLYNYFAGTAEQPHLGTYMGLEADGSFTGFSGCDTTASRPFFESGNGNSGNIVNSTLCPLGKYGYDCRCREWYIDSYAQEGFIHVTSPYVFAYSGLVGMSAGAALIDPTTREHIGEALIDFSPGAFIDAVKSPNTAIGHGGGGFPVIITPTTDQNGDDTLVGPGFAEGTGTARIGDLVLPHDGADSANRRYFEIDVLKRMRSGQAYFSKYTGRTSSGEQQNYFMTYAPVMLRSLRALNHSDFAAGVESKYAPVYLLGFGISVEDLAVAFEEVEVKVDHDISQVAFVSLALAILAVLMVMYMTYTMTIYLAQPILCLVGIVKSIADKTLMDELPSLQGGSYEIHAVYDSLEKLCKIVRFSNAAYFKGNRTKSYKVLEEAIELFMKMGNQKALGVANNNLGTMVLQDQMERSSATAQSKEQLLAGMKYFDEAIRIGTFEYQNADFDDSRGDFVKQLANRYFNRGMYHIVNRNHPHANLEFENNGCSDLNRAKSLDQEAYLYWRERGQIVARARNEFFCVLRRARGMLTMMEATGFQDIWGVDTLIDKAFDMIHNPAFSESSLFENVNLIARRQQVDDLKIQYSLSLGHTLEAAKIAMRLLVEEEYVVDTVMMNCVTTINNYYDLEHGDPNELPNLAEGLKSETRRGQVDAMREAKNIIFCLDYSGSMAGERMARANMNLLWLYEEHCLDKDYVGFCRFNHAVDDKLYFDLERKGGKQEEHGAILGQALDAEGGTRLYAALNRCVTMALACDNDFDTWIVALTDGESAWDFPAKQVINRIEKNNKQEGSKIHVIVIGFEVSPEVADSVAIVTKLTEKSMYLDATGGLDEMDNAFERVAEVVTGTAITMETF